jgi:hypothetical protein
MRAHELLMALVLSLVSGAGLARGDAPSGRRVLVVPLEARSGVGEDKLRVLSDYLLAEMRRVGGLQVVGEEDIRQALTLEQQRQLVGCDAASCLAEVAGALAAEEVLYGSLGRLGTRDMVLTLSRVDTRSVRPLGGEAERLKRGDTDAMFDAVSRMLVRLYPTYQPPDERVSAMNPVALGAVLSVIGAALQYATYSTYVVALTLVGCPPAFYGLSFLSLAACAGGPISISIFQGWLADVVGRRQVGLLGPMVSGMATLGSCLGGAVVVELAIMTSSLGLLPLLVARRVVGRGSVSAVGLLTGVAPYLAGVLLATGLTAAPLFAGAMVAPAVVQAAVMLLDSRRRPAGEDPRVPGLFRADRDPPLFLRWLPRPVVGGREDLGDDMDPAHVAGSEPEREPKTEFKPVASAPASDQPSSMQEARKPLGPSTVPALP